MSDDHNSGSASSNSRSDTRAAATEDDPRVIKFRNLFSLSDARLATFLRDGSVNDDNQISGTQNESVQDETAPSQPEPKLKKKPARVIDEDDYGDDDDEDEEDDQAKVALESPVMQRTLSAISTTSGRNASPMRKSPTKPSLLHRQSVSSELPKSSDETRKKAQHDKEASEAAAKRDFHTMFYTLEHDHAAMLEQSKLDELDRQVEAEVSGDGNARPGSQAANGVQVGSLSSANLGASSLMLKHLLARMDKCRHMISAHDSQLRRLISEVRKNRSKWASEEKIGQEELYEAAEKVLQELKAMTEYSTPFLHPVKKRDAPDYNSIIKTPMDISQMLKRLKTYHYVSKKQFVEDLNLIWNNCLRYNSDPAHPLRKKALYMQKQTESLVFLIPDIVIRNRRSVEAEERKMQHLDAELDGIDDSDDEPIMASRGRKAPSKAKKGVSTSRKSAPSIHEGTPEAKPQSLQNIRNEHLRAESDAPIEGLTNGFGSPGNLTPIGATNGEQSQADASDMDGLGVSAIDMPQESEYADMEFRTWKQVTKKPRAMAAAERNRLFVHNRINPEEPALLRNKAGMRRFARLHQQYSRPDGLPVEVSTADAIDGVPVVVPGQTLAEGVEAAEDDNILPDYYDPVSAIPDIDSRLTWEVDDQGEVISHYDECLRRVPQGHFTAPQSAFSQRMDTNMRQIQETRKICSKINIVKQMQLQVQIYQNQFQKYEPQPFLEADVDTLVVSDDGPIIAPEVCRAALQRTLGKVFFNAGFSDFQPTALETATDFIAEHIQRLGRTFASYIHAPQLVTEDLHEGRHVIQKRFTVEEAILHTMNEHSIDLDGLDSYVTDDMDRLQTKLGVMNERMKSHLADLLRPALDPSAGTDGVGAFNDGSEQFVSGDFAEEMNEDFFGFRELGLDKEFSMDNLSVPFHLLHNRMQNAFQSQNAVYVFSCYKCWNHSLINLIARHYLEIP